jgi:hypothetical protein
MSARDPLTLFRSQRQALQAVPGTQQHHGRQQVMKTIKLLTGCARCGGDHEDVAMQPLIHDVQPKPGKLWVEIDNSTGDVQEACDRLRDQLNNGSVSWRHLAWNYWAACPTTGQPIMCFEPNA